MLGDALLVAPVVQQGDTRRAVYLPAGPAHWQDFHGGTVMAAGRWHEVEAGLGVLPLFVRAGTLVPTAEPDATD
jgi:alpha-glucosidase